MSVGADGVARDAGHALDLALSGTALEHADHVSTLGIRQGN